MDLFLKYIVMAGIQFLAIVAPYPFTKVEFIIDINQVIITDLLKQSGCVRLMTMLRVSALPMT
jgi:hypothetical protein